MLEMRVLLVYSFVVINAKVAGSSLSAGAKLAIARNENLFEPSEIAEE